jgi:hypothetical protein
MMQTAQVTDPRIQQEIIDLQNKNLALQNTLQKQQMEYGHQEAMYSRNVPLIELCIISVAIVLIAYIIASKVHLTSIERIKHETQKDIDTAKYEVDTARWESESAKAEAEKAKWENQPQS